MNMSFKLFILFLFLIGIQSNSPTASAITASTIDHTRFELTTKNTKRERFKKSKFSLFRKPAKQKFRPEILFFAGLATIATAALMVALAFVGLENNNGDPTILVVLLITGGLTALLGGVLALAGGVWWLIEKFS